MTYDTPNQRQGGKRRRQDNILTRLQSRPTLTATSARRSSFTESIGFASSIFINISFQTADFMDQEPSCGQLRPDQLEIQTYFMLHEKRPAP